MLSSNPEEIVIVGVLGIHTREGRELALAAEEVGLAVRPLAFGSALADAALAAQGPGAVRLPLVIVADRYSLERPAFGVVLECVEVLRGGRRTLPAACIALVSTAGFDGHHRLAIKPVEPGSRSTIEIATRNLRHVAEPQRPSSR
jgi:hypothetical protein